MKTVANMVEDEVMFVSYKDYDEVVKNFLESVGEDITKVTGFEVDTHSIRVHTIKGDVVYVRNKG